jgi:PAS domain S-box-containing protein
MFARLGWPVPDAQALPTAIAGALDQVRLWADDADAAAAGGDGARHPCDDPRVLAAASLVDRVGTAAYFSGDQVWIWLVCLAAKLWRTHGGAAELTGALGHAALATIVGAQDYRTGYRATRRMLEETSRLDHPTAHAYVMFLHALSSAPWFEPMPQVVAQARAAREALVRGGDPWAASFTYFASLGPSVAGTFTVAEWEAEAASGLAMTDRTGDYTTAATLLAHRQAARALAGRTQHPGTLSDDGFDADAHLAALGPNVTAKANFHWCCAQLAAVCGDQVGLDEHSAALMPLLAYVGALQITTGAYLLRGLACAWRLREEAAPSTAPSTGPSAADSAADSVGPSAAAELEECRAWLASRADDNPGTFAHMVSLLDAERAWASGDLDGAARAFESACAQAEAADLPGPRGLVLERYGRLLLERGLDQLAGLALHRARQRYAQWGATAKVTALDEEFGDRLDGADGAGCDGDSDRPPASSRSMSVDSVDLLAVLQAFQILSTATTPARLQEQVTQVLAMLTGATQVRLVLWDADSGGWVLPRPGADGGADHMMLTLAEAAVGALVPLSAFRYVERTGQTLVVADVATDPRFAGDPYFEGVGRCALLAVPVLIRGVARAVLLLGNRLARGAFSARRLDAVQLITAELGICLDNMLAERFRSLVQRSADLTVVCDPEGAISYASSASADLLGMEEAALVGRRLADVVAEEDATALAGALAAVGDQARPTVQLRVLHADGQPRWVEATLADLTADPAVGGIMGRLHDITERHRLEIELRHAQKLESVGQLASGIAHEINTPLQFISSNLHFLTDAFDELVGPVAGADGAAAPTGPAAERAGTAELLEEIPTALAETIEGTERVITIVKAMKAFGHPGGDDKREVDLNEAVRMTLVVAANEIRSVADVVTDLGELPPVRCTVGDINQVVLNLVVNAVHAMADRQAAGGARGTLTVRTRRDDADVLIEVGDTGVGIPPEIAHRVFDQFFTTKPVGRGTGQGLALAHALVHDHHGGNLDFASKPGVGTVFTVRLPITGDR